MRTPPTLVALTALATLNAVTARTAGAAEPAHDRITVAVSYFDNHSGDDAVAPLARGLADMLITDLSAIHGLTVVERARLNEVLAELKLSDGAFIDPKTAQKLGRGLSASYILTGGFLLRDGVFRIDARLIRVETGAVTAARKVEGRPDQFFALEKELVELLVERLAIPLDLDEKTALRRSATESFDAWREYSRGLQALDEGDRTEARRRFDAALAADPRYRAASDARGRLDVLLARHAERNRAAIDALWRDLDPAASDFGARVDALFMRLALGQDSATLKKKVALLRWLVSEDLTPSNHGFARAPIELMGLASRLVADPLAWDLIPGVCEYILTRYPAQAGGPAQCKAFMTTIDALARRDRAMMREHFLKGLANATHEWEVALADNYEDIVALMKLCAAKAIPPHAAPRPAP